MIKTLKRKDGFIGEKQINIPALVLDKYILKQNFLNTLYLTHIGFFPKAFYHFRERKKGCADNILFYCISGKGYFNTQLGNFELNANQFTILPANQPHRYQADISDPWSIYWIHFSGEKLAELNQFINIDHFNCATNIRYNEQIIQLWEQMYFSLNEEYNAANLGQANLCLYHFLSLFIFPEREIKKSAEDDKIAEAIHYLKNNINKSLSVQQIAEQFHFSASHFSALFKNKMGRSPIEYFIQLKIHYACQLLDQSSLRVKEIAEKIGYEDAFYFSRQFRKIMGCSPYNYKLRNNE